MFACGRAESEGMRKYVELCCGAGVGWRGLGIMVNHWVFLALAVTRNGRCAEGP